MPLKKPSKIDARRASILDKLFDCQQEMAVLRKACKATARDMIAMERASTIRYKQEGVYEITDDGRALVRIARKKTATP